MGWKDWPAWLKGGLIGLSFMFVVIPIFFMVAKLFIDNLIGIWVVFSLSVLPATFLTFYYIPDSVLLRVGVPMVRILSFIFSAIFWFVICAIIGWIFGKIKNR